MAKAPFNLEYYKKALNIEEVAGEKGYTTNERTGIRPTFDVCGIWGGYTGEGAKTVLPSKAYAKISTRLVPNQKHKKIEKLFVDYFESIAPKSVKVKVEYLHGGPSYVCPIDLPAYKAAEKAYKEIYGKEPIPVRSGGSIPSLPPSRRYWALSPYLWALVEAQMPFTHPTRTSRWSSSSMAYGLYLFSTSFLLKR